MTLLSIDPGRSKNEASIGWALFDNSGKDLGRGTMTFEEFVGDQLRNGLHLRLASYADVPGITGLEFTYPGGTTRVDRIAIENFVNDPGVPRGGQENGTSECIGAVEALCLITQTPFVRRSRTVLKTAMQHTGYVQTVKHLPHADAAWLHGREYLLEIEEKAREEEIRARVTSHQNRSQEEL